MAGDYGENGNGNGRRSYLTTPEGTLFYRRAMIVIGTMIMSVLGWVAITFQTMIVDVEKMKDHVAMLERTVSKQDAAISDLWREFWQRDGSSPHR